MIVMNKESSEMSITKQKKPCWLARLYSAGKKEIKLLSYTPRSYGETLQLIQRYLRFSIAVTILNVFLICLWVILR